VNVSVPVLAAAAAPAPTPARAPAIFQALAERLAKNAALAREVGACLQFDVTGPEGHWVVDLTGAGSVREGTDAKATTVLRIADGELAALCKDPQSAREQYQRGVLRVGGDVRGAQKLAFLKDLA
jgi:3-hydroxyacyl-CoA dehydrogenase/3a,7a,12a-trihydroxy-5b-cholest-24-enoyl-CoA hydratase